MKSGLESKARERQAKPNPIDFWSPASLIATVFGVGKLPAAPGTWASAIPGQNKRDRSTRIEQTSVRMMKDSFDTQEI